MRFFSFLTVRHFKRMTRKEAKLSLLIALPILSILFYSILPAPPPPLPPRIPWTNFEWEDEDFQAVAEIVILRWTRFFHRFWYPSPEIFLKGDKCGNPDYPDKMEINCRFTYDRRYLQRSNALLFHLWDVVDGEEMPPHHYAEQIWILGNHEAPTYQAIPYRNFLNDINWTLTYRKDSDYYSPYGRIIPRTPDEPAEFDDAYFRSLSSNKSKLAAWIVSKCKTPGKREELVSQLARHIPVDIFGKCGNHSCPSGPKDPKDDEKCYRDVALQYKFYFAFENSLCVDYVTEKFFYSMANSIVPVVYGGSEYSRIAPEGSFINVRDFKSAKELADYLIFLDEDLEEYLKYFQWKRKYKVVNKGGMLCGLCQKLYGELYRTPSLKNYKETSFWKKEYGDVPTWWNSRTVSGEKEPACEETPFYAF